MWLFQRVCSVCAHMSLDKVASMARQGGLRLRMGGKAVRRPFALQSAMVQALPRDRHSLDISNVKLLQLAFSAVANWLDKL